MFFFFVRILNVILFYILGPIGSCLFCDVDELVSVELYAVFFFLACFLLLQWFQAVPLLLPLIQIRDAVIRPLVNYEAI